MTDRTIEYLPVVSLTPDPANPKAHSVETITDSMDRFGYVEPIVRDDRTGYIISGHGRTKTLRAAMAEGVEPPEGVRVGPDGMWLAPVVTGWSSGNDIEARAALVALNRTTELGGWVDESLLEVLDSLVSDDPKNGLRGVGFTDDDLTALREALLDLERDAITSHYTRTIPTPQYTPTLEEPPAVADLLDYSKTLELQARIQGHPDLPEEVRDFLNAAAWRHTSFHYARIAEFYAHAPKDVQLLMEQSALVILDFDNAVENGFVRFSKAMNDILVLDAGGDLDTGEDL